MGLEDNVYEAAVKMKQYDIGCIPVIDKDSGKLLGLVTDRDLVVRGIADKHPGSAAIESVMTRNVYTATPDMKLDEAAEIMAEHQIRRLPVIEGERLIGLVALGDLALARGFTEEAGEALTEISERVH